MSYTTSSTLPARMEPRHRPGRDGRGAKTSHLRRPAAQRVPTKSRASPRPPALLLQRGRLPLCGKYNSCSGSSQAQRLQDDGALPHEEWSSLEVVSACRCPSRNAAVGGSSTSRHLTGRACDVEAIFCIESGEELGGGNAHRLRILQPEGQAHRQGLQCNSHQSARLRQRKPSRDGRVAARWHRLTGARVSTLPRAQDAAPLAALGGPGATR